MKKSQIIMVAVFCVMLFSGSLAITVLPDQKYSDLENRQLQQKPKFTKKNFTKGTFQTEYENYLNDQFPLRDRWVDAAVALQTKLGKRTLTVSMLVKKDICLKKTIQSNLINSR